MRIGIDVDGVLTQLDKYQIEKGKKYFGENTVIDTEKYDIKDIFNCSKQDREKFWTKYIWEYCLKSPVSPHAAEIIRKWKNEGHEISIITGRVHTTKNNIMGKIFRRMLEYWLEKSGIVYDRIVYCDEKTSAEDKVDVCRELEIDVMLEDKIENIEALKKVCKIISFDALYNRKYQNSDIPKIYNCDFKKADEELEKIKNDPDFLPKKHFVILDGIERSKLSVEEKIEYYHQVRKYYMNLPYPDKEMAKLERNYKIAVKIGMPFFNLIFKPLIINREFIPKSNGYIFVSNHLGSLDQFPIMSAIGSRPIHFMVAKKLLHLKRGFLYKHTGSFFVDRNDPISKKETTDLMIQSVVNDKNIFIFPEGTRNYTDKYMLEFKKGAAAIAQTTGRPIVPFAVNNNYNILKKDRLIVRAGKPFYVLPEDDIEIKTKELEEIIATMIWENAELEQELLKKEALQKRKTRN